jgi:hypothetical protein
MNLDRLSLLITVGLVSFGVISASQVQRTEEQIKNQIVKAPLRVKTKVDMLRMLSVGNPFGEALCSPVVEALMSRYVFGASDRFNFGTQIDHIINSATRRERQELDNKVRTAVNFRKFLIGQNVPSVLRKEIASFVDLPGCWNPTDAAKIGTMNNHLPMPPGQQQSRRKVKIELLGDNKAESAEAVCVRLGGRLVFGIATPSKNRWTIAGARGFQPVQVLEDSTPNHLFNMNGISGQFTASPDMDTVTASVLGSR